MNNTDSTTKRTKATSWRAGSPNNLPGFIGQGDLGDVPNIDKFRTMRGWRHQKRKWKAMLKLRQELSASPLVDELVGVPFGFNKMDIHLVIRETLDGRFWIASIKYPNMQLTTDLNSSEMLRWVLARSVDVGKTRYTFEKRKRPDTWRDFYNLMVARPDVIKHGAFEAVFGDYEFDMLDAEVDRSMDGESDFPAIYFQYSAENQQVYMAYHDTRNGSMVDLVYFAFKDQATAVKAQDEILRSALAYWGRPVAA